MQNKILHFLKKLSIVTTHPNDDWMKVFILLFVLAVVSLSWNIHFYIEVKRDIDASLQNGVTKAVQVTASEEQTMKAVTGKYDARAAVHQGIIEGAPTEVADPA